MPMNVFVELLLRTQTLCRAKLSLHDGKVEFQCLDSSDRELLLSFFIRSDALVKFLGKLEGLKIRVLLAKLAKVLYLFAQVIICFESKVWYIYGNILRVFHTLYVSHGVSRSWYCFSYRLHEGFYIAIHRKRNRNATVSFFSTKNFKGGVQPVMQQH